MIRPASKAAIGALLLMAAGCLPPSMTRQAAEQYPDVLFSVDTEEKLVALTVDDGPTAEHTAQLLDVLAAHDAKATFFLMARRIPGNEALVRRMVEEGHELGHHMLTNAPSFLLGPEEFDARFDEAARRIEAFGEVRWFRPAWALSDNRMRCRVKARGYETVLAAVYPNDFSYPVASYQERVLLENVRPGDVVVVHDGRGQNIRSPLVLSRVLPELKRRGYRFVTLSELVERGRWAGLGRTPAYCEAPGHRTPGGWRQWLWERGGWP